MLTREQILDIRKANECRIGDPLLNEADASSEEVVLLCALALAGLDDGTVRVPVDMAQSLYKKAALVRYHEMVARKEIPAAQAEILADIDANMFGQMLRAANQEKNNAPAE